MKKRMEKKKGKGKGRSFPLRIKIIHRERNVEVEIVSFCSISINAGDVEAKFILIFKVFCTFNILFAPGRLAEFVVER